MKNNTNFPVTPIKNQKIEISSKKNSIIQTHNGVEIISQPKPQTIVKIENIPIQKFYTDFQPVITHQHVAYQRSYEEQHQTSLGVSVNVAKTMTDYQTIQHTNFQPIKIAYTDYQQIEFRTEFIPKIKYQTITQHIPSNQIDKIIEQHPFKINYIQENGQQLQVLEIINLQKSVPKQDFITQQRVQQIIEYEEYKTERILNESTVLQPEVQCPQPQQIIVQQSIHEPQLNQSNNEVFYIYKSKTIKQQTNQQSQQQNNLLLDNTL